MKELRELLPGIRDMTYLDYARNAPLMEPVAKRIAALIEESKEPLQFHRDAWMGYLESARKLAASLIGASPEEIALTTSTSVGLSLIAQAIRWNDGDRVLFPADEYPSNRFVWENLDGVVAEPIEPIKGISFAEQLEQLDLSHVRLVAVSAVSFSDGRKHDLELIERICHSKGILIAVDAIQAIGAIPVNVEHCDFIACGGQKWLFGPIGTGFVYFKKELIPMLRVPQMGWGNIKPLPNLLAKKFNFAEGAKRFEPSYFHVPAFAGLALALETMGAIGWEKIYGRIQTLTDKAQKELRKLGCEPVVKGAHAGIISFDHSQAEKIQNKLSEKKIYITQRQERLRVSLHASVSDEDLANFFTHLRALL